MGNRISLQEELINLKMTSKQMVSASTVSYTHLTLPTILLV